jgi:UDP-glucuronate decarboxylase
MIKKKVLVTGGAGFVGSHLCDRLLADGHEVVSLDNYFTGQKQNIVHLIGNPYFELVRHDVTMPFFIEVDEIYNLACPASPIHYQYNAIKTMKTSVMGAINMLGLAKRIKAKILQASTSEVYGDPQIHPQIESYWGHVNPIGERACYDEGKRAAETLFINYHKQNNVKIKIIRIFNTYGPRQSARAIIPTIISQIASGMEEIKLGDLTPTRDFNYVKDTARGFLALAQCDETIGREVNIATMTEISMRDTLELVKKIMNSNVRFITDEERLRPANSEVFRLLGDNTLICSLTSWKPAYSLEQGLSETINWFQNPANLAKFKTKMYNL